MFKRACLLLPYLFAIVLAGWAPEEQITKNKTVNNLALNNGHKVVVATNGVRHVVWERGGVFYKRYYPGSGWTSDYQLTKIQNSRQPSIALDANGTDIHVVWDGAGSGRQARRRIYYLKCVPGSSGNDGWVGTPRDISGQAPGRDNESPAVACFQGRVVVTWSARYSDSIGFCECVEGNWGIPSYFVDPAGYPAMAWYPSIAVDPQARYGDVYISYGFTPNPGPGQACVLRRQNGEWQQREIAAGGDNSYSLPCIEVDPGTGYPHVVCHSISSEHIYHTYWNLSLGWQPVEMISDPSALSSRHPSTFFSGSSAFVVWPELSSSNVPGIMYSIGQYGNWTTPEWVTSGYSDEWPSVTARSNGDVYVVWQDGRTSNNQIWGRLYTPGSFDVGGSAQATNEGTMENKVKEDLFYLTIAPNPAINLTTVRHNLPVAGRVSLKLYNAFGREIRVFVQGNYEPGRYSVNLNTHTLAQGVYYLKYESSNYRDIKKLIVQR